MGKFLIISIPTYNRADKLSRILSLFLQEIIKSQFKDEIGIFISNNGSTDNTMSAIISFDEKFTRAGIQFEYENKNKNIGMDLNYLNMIHAPNAKYIWFFSDDDVLFENRIDGLMTSIKKHMPSVCNFSFIQKPYDSCNFRYKGLNEGIYTDVKEYPTLVTTKISSCILSTKHLGGYVIDDEVVVGTCWAYIPYIFSNLLEDNKLLIYPYPVASSDDDHLQLRYDPIVFTNLYGLIESIYKKYNRECDFKQSKIIKPVPMFTDINFLIKFITDEVVLDDTHVEMIKKRIMLNLLDYKLWLDFRMYKNILKLLFFTSRLKVFNVLGIK